MPHEYQRTPFNTSEPVVMYQGCHGFASGAKDIGFYTMQWGEPVYAVESGTVVEIVRDSNCFSPKTSSMASDPSRRTPPGCDMANLIVIRGNDGFFTEYAHVLPSDNLSVNSTVQAGTFLGNVDNSAETEGPHVHLARYNPTPANSPNRRYFENGGTCDWTMRGVPAIRNGWLPYNGTWYYFENNTLLTGWVQFNDSYWFELDSNSGAWTGNVWIPGQGRCAHWENGRLNTIPCPF
ncbi:peptidoglycan DD-metalloendopeptidase family protein [Priestia megaterium]|uniref:M23 family metallopeptidase n=1 Tax=Priestia megaterium TaxID=1404 RepID=UPI003F8035CE